MAKDVDDDAFLAGVTEFLNEYTVPVDVDDFGEQHETTEGQELLCSSLQLAAETETLLSTCSTATSALKKMTESQRKRHNENAAKRRRKYVTKLKEEKLVLKQQEKELMLEIQTLQAKRSNEQRFGVQPHQFPVWRAIAVRQMQARIAAEKERRRLLSEVASRNASIQRLGKSIQEQLRRPDENPVALAMSLSSRDIAVFERFLEEMDGTYLGTDKILNSWKLQEPCESAYCQHQRKCEGGIDTFEGLEVQLIPFKFKPTSDAMWRSMQLHHRRKNHQHYRGVFDPESTIAVKFHVVGHGPSGGSVSMLVHMVLRRYQERDRMIIVWRAKTTGEGVFSHLQADETGWTIVTPNDQNTASGSMAMPTTSRTIIHFTPFSTANPSGSAKEVDEFSKLAGITGAEDGLEVVRMMESLLLGSA